ncbi:MAG: sugar phosphate isomerase/epimerase [Anaerolineales bacterium]|nr:sugar phosphate isomerase/epimerase [Anaerolineales bacterium]
MKISLYTISLSGGYYRGPAVPLMDILPLAQQWGYDGVELEAKRPHGSPLDLNGDLRERLRDRAGELGLAWSCVAAYNDFSSPIEEHRENELLMLREQIRLAVDLGAPIVRVMAAWSGVTRRDGAITYDVARYNIDHRFPGTLALERWVYARECLAEGARMAADAGVTLALQNHKPLTNSWRDVLTMLEEIGSPALQVCLDAPLFDQHTEAAYREALSATGARMVHSHYGGRFERRPDGQVAPIRTFSAGETDNALFMRLAHDLAGFSGHNGYELCSPVLIGHRFAGQAEALLQCQLAAEYMRAIIAAISA